MSTEMLAKAIDAARTRWPGVPFEAEALARFLASKGLSADARSPERLEELALTQACSVNLPNAIGCLEASFGRAIREAITRASASGDVDEMAQRVRLRLFTQTPARGAKIAEFTGEGALTAWLRTVATRVALTAVSATADTDQLEAHLEKLVLELPSPEDRVARDQARAMLKRVLSQAVRALGPRERTLVKLSGVDGLTMEQIGVVYGVHKATVSRWLGSIRADLLRATQQVMREQLKLSSSEAFELVGAAGSQLELSISRLLQTTEAAS